MVAGTTPRLPFGALLDELRLKGLSIGIQEYQRFALLLSKWDGRHATELRSAAAALLAKNPEQVAIVAQTFDDLYVNTPSETRPPEPPPRRWTDHLLTWHIGIAVGLVILAGALLAPPGGQPTSVPPVDKPLPESSPGSEVTYQRPNIPEPERPLEPTTSNAILLAAVVIGASVLAGCVVLAYRTRKFQMFWTRRARGEVLAAGSGPYYYSPTVTPRQPTPLRKAIDDAATILGRRFVKQLRGAKLDVDESLAATLRAGLRPHLLFQKPRRPSAILLLQDIGSEMRFWSRKVNTFVEQLRRSGVLIDRWYFDEDATLVSRRPHGRVVSLASLARQQDGAALLVVSTGAGVAAASERDDEGWLSLLEQWIDRAWLTPISHPLYWRSELRRPGGVPMSVMPMTRSGILAAAKALSQGNVKRAVPMKRDVRSVTPDDVERMKRVVAIAGHPTFDLLELLRQEYAPDIPEDVALFLEAEAAGYSADGFRLDQAEASRVLAAEHREGSTRERDIRRLMKRVLDNVQPPSGSIAQLRWQLDKAVQDLHLSSLEPEAFAPPIDALQSLAASPLADEVRETLKQAQPTVQGAARRLIDDVGRRARVAAASLAVAQLGTRRLWPGRSEAIACAVTAVAMYAVLAAGGLSKRVVAHEQGAYVLDWEEPGDGGGTLVARRAASNSRLTVPDTVDLLRNGELVGQMASLSAGNGATRALNLDDTGAYYQIRAQLPEGNLALSNLVLVPIVKREPAPEPDPEAERPAVDEKQSQGVVADKGSGTAVQIPPKTPAARSTGLVRRNPSTNQPPLSPPEVGTPPSKPQVTDPDLSKGVTIDFGQQAPFEAGPRASSSSGSGTVTSPPPGPAKGDAAPTVTGTGESGKTAAAPSGTIVPKGNYRATYQRAMESTNRRRWEEARQLLEVAIRQYGKDTGERIEVSGFGNNEPYLPYYYLGVALMNLGRCDEALRAWQLSEQQGAIQGTDRFDDLKRDRQRCAQAK